MNLSRTPTPFQGWGQLNVPRNPFITRARSLRRHNNHSRSNSNGQSNSNNGKRWLDLLDTAAQRFFCNNLSIRGSDVEGDGRGLRRLTRRVSSCSGIFSLRSATVKDFVKETSQDIWASPGETLRRVGLIGERDNEKTPERESMVNKKLFSEFSRPKRAFECRWQINESKR